MAQANEVAVTRKVHVVLGSVRAGRICPQIADWVLGALDELPGVRFETVDLADWHLPMNDEPGVPAREACVQPHTLAWSRKVEEASGFVFVAPQYNWGYPAALKNALDHLYEEWNGKPALIVSYGYHGGDKCAAQLRQVLIGLKMRPTEEMAALTLSHDMFGADGRLLNPATSLAPQAACLRQSEAAFAALLGTTAPRRSHDT